MWDELAPGTTSIAEARRHRVCVPIGDTGTAKLWNIENAIITPIQPGEPENEEDVIAEALNQEQMRIMRERIRTLGA